jgi:hypothetical protein
MPPDLFVLFVDCAKSTGQVLIMVACASLFHLTPNGIENNVLHHSPSWEEIYISKEATKELFAAIGQLTAI